MKRLLYITFLLGVTIFLFNVKAFSQKLSLNFIQPEIQIVSGDLVSNIVRIQNLTSDSVSFKVSTDFPSAWKQLSRFKDRYTIAPFDSMFIPTRFIVGGDLTGNNRFMLSAFITDIEDQPLGSALFWSYTLKKTSWSVSNNLGGKVYFKNGQNTVDFKLNIVNTGTETQPIILSINNLSLFSEITDSTEKTSYKIPVEFQLQPYQDTSFGFKFKYTQGKRNETRIDMENYRPENLSEEKIFNVLINTEEPNYGQPGVFQAGQRLTFKKLSDNKMVNGESFSKIPLIVDYNVNNFMNAVSFTTINVRGLTQISSNEQLIYNLQANASSNDYAQFFENVNYYLGYFFERGQIQGGFINGGIMGIQSFGKGLKSTYLLDKRGNHKATGFYVYRNDRFGNRELTSLGAVYEVNYFKKNKAQFELGHSDNPAIGVKSTAMNARASYIFLRSQTINFTYSHTVNEISQRNQPAKTTTGYSMVGNYNGNFKKGDLNINHGAGYTSPQYANSGVERFFYSHRTRYIINNTWSTTLVNNYNTITTILPTGIVSVSSITNQYSVNAAFNTKSIQPTIFHNIFKQTTFGYDITGGGISFNIFNPAKGTRITSSFEAGINTPRVSYAAERTNFLQWNSLILYKTLSVNARYMVGTYGYVPTTANSGISAAQQLFTSSAQHQYVFKNTKLMLQTGVNYFFNNIFKQHSITIFPDLYYFTSDGWRLRFGVNYNFISSQSLQNSYGGAAARAEEPQRINQQGVLLSIGVRKEFSLPMPFKNVKHTDVEFVAFFDVNGNGLKDKNERTMENVVIRLGDEEVITNKEGRAQLRNTAVVKQYIAAFPIEETPGWFPNIDDTVFIFKKQNINIPFVRGVRIRGKIAIDRESVNADSDEPFDLSRIRVVANGNKSYNTLTDFKGNFEMYLPYGKYTISVDESVLGSKFKLARNNYEIESNKESDGMVISFLIIEKKRKIIKKVFTQPLPTNAAPQNNSTMPKPSAPAPTTPNNRNTQPRRR